MSYDELVAEHNKLRVKLGEMEQDILYYQKVCRSVNAYFDKYTDWQLPKNFQAVRDEIRVAAL